MQTSVALPAATDIVADEVALLTSLVDLDGARLLELGCGAADFARKVVARSRVASVTAFEVDRIQHDRNLAGAGVKRLSFAFGGAEAIKLPDGCVDGVLMMKSLHHVPMMSLDRALGEIARVLKPGGWFYASEPVYDGEFNDLIKLFHDEGVVRDAAYKALGRAHLRGVLREDREIQFMAPVAFKDFEDFDRRVIRTTHSDHDLPPKLRATVRERFEKYMKPGGVKFIRPMRVNLMSRPEN
ncbi:MAG: class I SAM-dependent methyltransferase [Usitatibacter sp.]